MDGSPPPDSPLLPAGQASPANPTPPPPTRSRGRAAASAVLGALVVTDVLALSAGFAMWLALRFFGAALWSPAATNTLLAVLPWFLPATLVLGCFLTIGWLLVHPFPPPPAEEIQP